MEASTFLRNPCIATISGSFTQNCHQEALSLQFLHPVGFYEQQPILRLHKKVSASFHPSEEIHGGQSVSSQKEPWRRIISSSAQCSTAGDTASSGDLAPPRTLYLVDVHPLCYEGKKPRPAAILNWIELLFEQVSVTEPVIAVMDGERGNDYRRGLLPSYKGKRNKYRPLSGIRGPYIKGDRMDLRDAFPHIKSFLTECNVPVIKVDDAEADDVIATLMQQAVNKGMKAVIASPDMDYRQLLSRSVKMVLPLPEFGRWSFYTLQQYVAEHDCDPSIDLGLRCMLGDKSDNVPGLQEWSTGFGRKTALKLMKKHGSLENLLVASQTRTVGKPYIQDALAQYRDALYRNLQVLSLRRDLDITLEDEWLRRRDRSNEPQAFRQLRQNLQGRSSYARQ
ncbi:unnamed protein product [Calypogeia fissa]